MKEGVVVKGANDSLSAVDGMFAMSSREVTCLSKRFCISTDW